MERMYVDEEREALSGTAPSPSGKSTDRKLRESEEGFRLFVESVSDYAIFMLDTEGYIQTWNRGAQRLKGYQAEEIIGRHFSTFYPSSDLDNRKPERELEIAIRDGRVEDEGWRVRKDGTTFWASVVITALFGPDGTLRGFGKVTRDLTARKQTEDALRRVLEREREGAARLRELDQMKTEFVAIVAHDLRSPVHAVRGFVDMLLDRGEAMGEEQRRQVLEAIRRSSQTLAALIEDILEVSQIESGEFKIERTELDVGAVLRRAVAALEPSAAEREISIDVNERTPKAFADEQRTWQVMTNLLSNALKFSGTEGAVAAGVDPGPEGRHVIVWVRDDGVGVKPEDIPKLFQRFSRVGSQGGAKGTGLGLYICKRLVEAQGGTISVESEPEQGSTFSFTLPAFEEARV
jgi:PAS domain S-box-containing protein